MGDDEAVLKPHVLGINLREDMSLSFENGLDGINQHDYNRQLVGVHLDGFALAENETLHIAYAQSMDEDDLSAGYINYSMLAYEAELGGYYGIIPPEVLSAAGTWYFALCVRSYYDTVTGEDEGHRHTTIYSFSVLPSLRDYAGAVPSVFDIVALYRTAIGALREIQAQREHVDEKIAEADAAVRRVEDAVGKIENIDAYAKQAADAADTALQAAESAGAAQRAAEAAGEEVPSLRDALETHAADADAHELPRVREKLAAAETTAGELRDALEMHAANTDAHGISDRIREVLARVDADFAAYYTAAQVDERIGKIPKFAISAVDALPETPSETTVYLLKTDGETTGNLYAEYIYVSGAWELLGAQRVDLRGYATEEWVKQILPKSLAELSDDAGHRTVTDAEKTTWNGKAAAAHTHSVSEITDYPSPGEGLGLVDGKLSLVGASKTARGGVRVWLDGTTLHISTD